MKIIYHCYGRAHSSVIAAHLHLGNLPLDGRLHIADIIMMPLFDEAVKEDFGIPYYMGEDREGNSVYIIGFGNMTPVCRRTMESVLSILGRADEVFLVDALSTIGLSARTGGFLSRSLHWVALGRPLVAWGILRSLPRLRQMVKSVQEVVWENYGEKTNHHRH